MNWDADLYQDTHGFVSQYGEALLNYIHDKQGQRILDIGCGNGTLSAKLAERGWNVVGLDSSLTMLEKARQNFPVLQFSIKDAAALDFDREFDVVFSNACFHWILNQDALLDGVYRALVPHGQLVCEFGGARNIDTVCAAFASASGIDPRPSFFYPSGEAYRALLIKQGFDVEHIHDFDRPTPLNGGERGLELWLRQFFAEHLTRFSADEQAEIIRKTEVAARPALWNNKNKAWIADYRRIRCVAWKR
jgi:SAM-dependent methyltransferase